MKTKTNQEIVEEFSIKNAEALSMLCPTEKKEIVTDLLEALEAKDEQHMIEKFKALMDMVEIKNEQARQEKIELIESVPSLIKKTSTALAHREIKTQMELWESLEYNRRFGYNVHVEKIQKWKTEKLNQLKP